MYPDDDALPTLTRWPFYLGDAFLVGLAVTIATLDGWQLEGVQVFACVLSVALGAALLAFPFVTEFLMFAREENEDRAAELRLLKKSLESLESALLKQHERLSKLESRSGLDDQRYELLTSAIDRKMQVDLPDISALIKRIETIETFGTKETKASDALEKELVTLGKSIKQAVESLDVLQSRVDTLEKVDQKLPAAATSSKETTEATNRQTASEKRQKKKEASLLKRAIQEKQDTASKAVSRIIDSESKSVASDSEAKAADSPNLGDRESVSEIKTTQAEELETATAAQEIFSEIEQLPDNFSVSLGADLMMDDDLFGAEEVASPKQPTEPVPGKPVVTTVEINKLMGIGNKPFLRGSGAGLSWEKGVPMEFQEIGRWTWSTTVPANEAVELQVYRNDKDADRTGKHILKAGQELEIIPNF